MSTCYTSVAATASPCTDTINDPCHPYVWFMFEAVIPISAFLAIPQTAQDIAVTTSILYSSSLIVEVYKKLSPSFGIDTTNSEI